MATYITEAEFNKYCRDAARFLNQNRVLVGWAVHSGFVYRCQQTGDVRVLYQDGVDLGGSAASLSAVDSNGEWFFEVATNTTYVYNDAADPNDLDMQAGEDHVKFVADIFARASKLIDRELDKMLVTQVPLDRSGNYDELLIQITCYKAAELVTNVSAPDLSVLYKELLLNDEDNGFLDRITAGTLLFDNQIDATDSRGKIRIVAVSGGIELIELRGRAIGVKHQWFQVKIGTGGAFGTATYTVKVTDSDGVPNNQIVIDDQIIKDNFMALAFGLEGRWKGDSADTFTADDEWEIEVRGIQESIDNPTVKSIFAGRGAY